MQSPGYLRGTFKYTVDAATYSSGNVHRLFLPCVKNNYGKAGLYYKGT